jgi:hydrogenase/urease accessory protein HupE
MRSLLLASLAAALAAPAAYHLNTISYPVFTVYERAIDVNVRVKLAYFTDLVDFGRPGMPTTRKPPSITEAIVRERQGKLVAMVEGALHVEANGEALAPHFEDLALTAAKPDPANPNETTLDEGQFRFRFESASDIERVRLRYELFAGHDPTHRGIAKIRCGVGERAYVFRRGDAFESTVAELRRDGALQAAGSFFLLGMEHIFTGYDHLAFLAGLLLVSTSLRSLFVVVTGFTVAHSTTLVAAVLRWVTLSPAIVEPAIAASVAFVGIENVVRRGESKRRWLLASAFGLVHGLGFAGFVNEVELPPGGTALCLASFNLGVEAGQATVVCLVFPILAWARERWPVGYRRFAKAASAGIALAGIWWVIDRVGLS